MSSEACLSNAPLQVTAVIESLPLRQQHIPQGLPVSLQLAFTICETLLGAQYCCRGESKLANLRVRLLAAATVNGKRSYYKPAMRSTGWPDGGAVLVKGRRVRIDASQLHAYYVTWLEGKKQQFENVGKDALSGMASETQSRGSAERRSRGSRAGGEVQRQAGHRGRRRRSFP